MECPAVIKEYLSFVVTLKLKRVVKSIVRSYISLKSGPGTSTFSRDFFLSIDSILDNSQVEGNNIVDKQCAVCFQMR